MHFKDLSILTQIALILVRGLLAGCLPPPLFPQFPNLLMYWGEFKLTQ